MNNVKYTRDEYYLNIAHAVSERSTCLRRKYGAVLVNNDEIISTGYNGACRGENDCLEIGTCKREELNIPKGERYELCRAVHAEQNAIISASRRDMIGATMYIYGTDAKTGQWADPTSCLLCQKFIKNSGIERVIGYNNEHKIEIIYERS